MLWYYAEGGVQKGPVNPDDLQKLVDAGTVGPDTLVWSEGMSDWQPYRVALAPKTPPPPAPQPASAAGPSPSNDALDQAVAATGGPAAAEAARYAPGGPQDAVAAGPARVYAGFWIRFVAKFLDWVLLFFVNLVIQLPLTMMFMPQMGAMESGDMTFSPAMVAFLLVRLVLEVAVVVLYNGFFLSKYAATPGKMALSLKVIRSDGSRVTFGRAAGRTFAEYLSGLILLIGYIIAAFDEEKRSLHDHICDTRVIRD